MEIEVGQTVRWYTKEGGWKFGIVEKLGRKWARVVGKSFAYGGSDVLIDDLRAWPPAERPTGDGHKVKRGRA